MAVYLEVPLSFATTGYIIEGMECWAAVRSVQAHLLQNGTLLLTSDAVQELLLHDALLDPAVSRLYSILTSQQCISRKHELTNLHLRRQTRPEGRFVLGEHLQQKHVTAALHLACISLSTAEIG